MALYQRSQTVEAEKLTRENAERLAAWCNGLVVDELDPFEAGKKFVAINFPTMTGNRRVSEGQYLVKDVGGFYRWDADDFERAFEKVQI